MQLLSPILSFLGNTSDGSRSLPFHRCTWKNTSCCKHSRNLYIAFGFRPWWIHYRQRLAYIYIIHIHKIRFVFRILFVTFYYLFCRWSSTMDEMGILYISHVLWTECDCHHWISSQKMGHCMIFFPLIYTYYITLILASFCKNKKNNGSLFQFQPL